MNLDDLTNPPWVTDEYGYESAPPELDRLGAYCFGILALADQHVILPRALRNYPGKGGTRGGNAWGGCAWVITEDGGATWRFRSGKTLAAKDLKADRGVPIEDTTFAHTERGVFTMVNLVQMGPSSRIVTGLRLAFQNHRA